MAGSLTLDAERASFFEAVIRVLGGLLSAHDLSGDRVFLTLAARLGDKLVPNFDATATGEREAWKASLEPWRVIAVQ